MRKRIDVVGARRSAVDHRSDPVTKQGRRGEFGRCDVDVEVDESRRYQLATPIEHGGGFGRWD